MEGANWRKITLRGMPDKILFAGPDIDDFVADQQQKLKKAYEALPDEQALDEQFVIGLKQAFMLEVPRLKPEEWTSERKQISPHSVEVTAFIPFDGDPNVFNIRPSSTKATVARGEIVGQEMLIRVTQTAPQFDVAAFVKRELGESQWRLESLRGSMEHMSQQLEITLRTCMRQRKRSIDNRLQISANIGIPQRKKVAPPPEPPKPVSAVVPSRTPLMSAQKHSVQQTWDIFISHASPDKPWVRGLATALRNNGITVWFDEDTLEWGEDLLHGINGGLKNCQRAILVLSKAYLAGRKWTEAELSALFTREKLGRPLILPIWHGVTAEDLKQYNLMIAGRVAKISESDNYDDIVRAVRKVLGREQTLEPTDPGQAPIAARPQDGTDKRELVAYAWYEQKGPNAKRAKIYIRRSDFMRGQFVLIDEENEHDGTVQDVAGKFFMGDRYLTSQGYTRSHFSNPSNIRAFDLP